MVLQQKLCCSLQLFFRHSGQETLTLAKWQWPELAGDHCPMEVLAQAGIVGMGKDQASRMALEDAAVAEFGHLMGSTLALEGLIHCPLSHPKIGG